MADPDEVEPKYELYVKGEARKEGSQQFTGQGWASFEQMRRISDGVLGKDE